MINIHDGRTEARGPLTYCRYQRGVRRPDPLRKPPAGLVSGSSFVSTVGQRGPVGLGEAHMGPSDPLATMFCFFGWPYSHDESLWSFHHGLLTSDRARWTSIEARWALIGSQRRRCFCFFFFFFFMFLLFLGGRTAMGKPLVLPSWPSDLGQRPDGPP